MSNCIEHADAEPICVQGRRVFEVAAAGFDGVDEAANECVFWVIASSDAEVIQAIQDTGAVFVGEVTGAGVGAADFNLGLPGQAMMFASALLEIASEYRNAYRAV